MKNTIIYSILLLAFLSLNSCGGEEFSPKPKGFNRIDLPKHEYQTLNREAYPYNLEYSVHAKVLRDSSKLAEPYWIDLYYPQFKSNIQITYKPITKTATLNELINDSYRLKGGHLKKAYAVDESMHRTKSGKIATIFQLEGEVPSQFQFFMTDSTQHFLRGALYFRTSLKNDSLAPVINYMKEDIMHLIETVEWKK